MKFIAFFVSRAPEPADTGLDYGWLLCYLCNQMWRPL